MEEIFGDWSDFRKLLTELKCHCLFRGHASADYVLLPTIGRPHRKYEPNKRVEEDLLAQFKLKALPYLKSTPVHDLEWLIIGRHYGLKTRLLDWTQNPFVALYFALQTLHVAEAIPCSIIIAKTPKLVNYFDVCSNHREQTELVFFEPPHLDMRIANQESYLALHPDPFSHLDDQRFIQFNFYPSIRKDLESLLFDIGVRHSTIYPDLGGVCSHLNDNPSFVAPSLDMGTTGSWKAIPPALVGLAASDIENGIIKKRSLWWLLNLHQPSSLIGIPLEKVGGKEARLRAFYGSEGMVSIRVEGEENRRVPFNEAEMSKYPVSADAIKKMYPGGGITFRVPVNTPLPK
jgi:hypothetical protein